MMSIADYTENKTSLLYYFALLNVYIRKIYILCYIYSYIYIAM